MVLDLKFLANMPLDLRNFKFTTLEPGHDCPRCPRLVAFRTDWRRQEPQWFNAPVPSFGPVEARLLIVGLAPGLRGANRTGRPFTGDGSGDFLFPVLHEAGFASQARATARDDGMRLTGLWISAMARCAPPANKPTPEELRNCAPWLDEELRLLTDLRVAVCLGRIAFDGLLAHAMRSGRLASRAGFTFRHGAEYALDGGLSVIASYHPSLQNTNTGKLTRAMFLDVFMRARVLAGLQ